MTSQPPLLPVPTPYAAMPTPASLGLCSKAALERYGEVREDKPGRLLVTLRTQRARELREWEQVRVQRRLFGGARRGPGTLRALKNKRRYDRRRWRG